MFKIITDLESGRGEPCSGLVMTGMVDYEKFSERPEQKTPNSIHKMVPHGKWAFTKEVEEKGNVTGKKLQDGV